MSFLFFIDWSRFRPEAILGGQVLERTPAFLSLIYLIGVAIITGFLVVSFIGQYRALYQFEIDLPKEVKKRLSLTKTNRSLRAWHILFMMLACTVFGFHVYWAYYAEDTNENFQALSYKDLRQRRTNASALRGWILDRTGKLENSLAYYGLDKEGGLERTYPLDTEMAHLIGTERGTPGLERTLFTQSADPMPEAWQVVTKIRRIEQETRDIRLTIDKELQQFAAQQLKGRKGAVVVLNPQTGELIAMYSNPSYSLKDMTQAKWLELEANKRDNPLLSRATREYYVPGSTFKTFTMITAFRAGMQNTTFTSSPSGFVPFNGSRAILDANGGCEPPYGCSLLNIAQAYEASSNQYFSQMAVALGRDRMKETAKLLGINAYDDPDDVLNASYLSEIWNATNERIKNGLALEQSSIVMGKKITAYDLALQGMGQGYAGQMTPFQMALIASVPANMEGRLMKPKIEFDRKPESYSQVVTPQQAAEMRQIMSLVTEGPGGTATRVFGTVRAAGIRSGGKTGTAEKVAPLYDEKTGKRKTETRRRKNKDGGWEEYQVPLTYERTDSWYISIAPLEKPTLAIAVVVEGGGFGASVAAPIAANIILKARDVGLLGEAYAPKKKTGEKSDKGGKKK